MKKILNSLGVFCSLILTLILSILIFIYAVILNVKYAVSENGIENTLKKIDVVETLKSVDDVMWEDFKQLSVTLSLSEEQFEYILNNNKVKEEVAIYLSEIFSSTFNDKNVTLTKEKVNNFLNVAIDEYNKLASKKITDIEKQQILNSFDEKMISNLNEEFGSINLIDLVDEEYARYIKLADNLLFDNYTLFMLIGIIFIIILIALFRFSYYKWIPYVKVSTVVSGSLMLIVGLFLIFIPTFELEILIPLKNLLSTRVFITSAILFILSIGLSILNKYLKNYIIKKKEEVKEEKVEVKSVKEKKNKIKFDKKTIIIIILGLSLLFIILFLIFGRKRSYIITFDTNGGTEITNIEVKNDEIVKLPEAPKKEGYKFIGWTNEQGKVITKNTKVTEDLTLKAEWVSDSVETITLKFDTDEGNKIDNIVIEKGKIILLPIEPQKEGYMFVGWLDENGDFIYENMHISNDIILKAMWIKKDAETVNVKFDTDGGSKVGSIILEKGKTILLPFNPIKVGYVFVGWTDKEGNLITKETIVNKDITIKAIWKEPYTCPSDCTPIGDGSACTKISVADLIVYTGCPSGTETVENFCSAHKRQVSVGFDEDQTFVEAGILCDGYPNGFCVDYYSRYTQYTEGCPDGYFSYINSPSGLDAEYGCVLKYSKGGSSCPSGYVREGDKCTRTETINCTAN